MSKTDLSITEALREEVDVLAEENADSTDSQIRYAAYGARLRTALRASSRYIAYTSDVGEAFRPVINPVMVRACYGISWLYLLGDVGYESYKAHRHGPTAFEAAHFSEPVRIGMAAAERATFQSIASMFVHKW
ncbi:mitochondrial 18 KDa protein-domain-containing protein [Mycena pura]|uniref:Mitochondrial fission process protein 1 n=1 Tax=Mycena pura TaxID=153505 RepID=A0AAD6YTK6_9AGAR|nr:mitochondrial 18 KDa protein-domain-containing protein [Mycena pura]